MDTGNTTAGVLSDEDDPSKEPRDIIGDGEPGENGGAQS